MFFVYILEMSDTTLYTGYTSNIDRRMDQHANGKGSKYVRARLPFKLIYHERYNSKSEAMKREIAIKNMKRYQKIKLINNSREYSPEGAK